MPPIIEVQNLVNQFGSQRVHDGLDFQVHSGEVMAIVGGSGTGKSVLIRTIMGLQRPTSGKVMVGGEDITLLSLHKRRLLLRKWGMLFQNGALFSGMSVLENVAFPLKEFTDLPKRWCDELARMKIELVGLDAVARDKIPSELSGGMVKRAALARALALDPHVLFLDEPTAGLDPISAASFDTLIKELSTNLGIAVVMITHDIDSLFSICDRIAVLVDKKIKLGTLEQHLQDDHPWIRSYFHGQRTRRIS